MLDWPSMLQLNFPVHLIEFTHKVTSSQNLTQNLTTALQKGQYGCEGVWARCHITIHSDLIIISPYSLPDFERSTDYYGQQSKKFFWWLQAVLVFLSLSNCQISPGLFFWMKNADCYKLLKISSKFCYGQIFNSILWAPFCFHSTLSPVKCLLSAFSTVPAMTSLETQARSHFARSWAL